MEKLLKRYVIYVDAGYKHLHEKPIYVAYVKKGDDGEEIVKEIIPEEAHSSTFAEYQGLKVVLTRLAQYFYGEVIIYNDNRNMVNQMRGRRPGVDNLVKEKSLCDFLWTEAVKKGNIILLKWVKGTDNKADKYVKQLKKELK